MDLSRYLEGDLAAGSWTVRLTAGALLGSCFAVFVPLILLLWWIEGPLVVTRSGAQIRIDLLSVLYPAGAVVSGGLFLLLTGLARSPGAKALLGALAFLPWFVGIMLCIDGGHLLWRPVHSAVSAIGSAALGGPVGWMLGSTSKRSRSAV